ncbi:MAG: tetratricopeptide repeat protein, partial [Planctomycetaceae bacterium]|nr:tetratricopeptide repeat protein [Planctomycetaceae bacterium]
EHSLARRAGNDRLADELAGELGDLPLALAQAAAYMHETQLPIGKYLELFRQRRTDLWGYEHGPLGHQETVAITFGLCIERLPDPAAVDLLNLCAFLAPDQIPRSLLREGGEHFPARVAAVVSDELELNRVLALLRSYSLIEITAESLSVHRLVQAVCRDRLNESSHEPQTSAVSETSEVPAAQPFAAAAVKLLNPSFPQDIESDTASWPICQRLLPHAHAAIKYAEQFGIDQDATGRLLNCVGLYLRICDNFVEAQSVLERAVRIGESAFGPEHPEVAAALNNLGLVLQELGDLPGARQAFNRALKINEAAFGPDHPKVGTIINNLGRVLRALGEQQGARQAFERALKIDETVFGPEHPSVATRVNNLGGVLKDFGDLAGARQAFERALRIDETAFGPEHSNVARDVNNLGGVLKKLGNLTGAQQAFERALKIDEAAFGPEHLKVAIRVNNIGGVLKDLGDLPGPDRRLSGHWGYAESRLGTSIRTHRPCERILRL